MTWTVVLPVKAPGAAKSRLEPDPARAALALAFAQDTVAAVRAADRVERVVLVLGDPAAAASLGPAEVVPDPGQGLNAALTAGLALAGDGPVALLLADLPALRPAELDDALRLAGLQRLAMVADAEGSGTTLLTALRPADLVPRFGPDSRARHEAAGHVVLAAGPGLRRDVDTADDLTAARALGLGPATTPLLTPTPPAGDQGVVRK